MDIEEYKQELAKHDWYYHMSEDHSAYSRGYDNESRLRLLAIDNEEFTDAFNKEQSKHSTF